MIKTFEKFVSKSDLYELVVDYLQDFRDHFSTTMNRVEWNGDHAYPPKYEFLLTVIKKNKYSVDIEILPDNSDLLYGKEFEKCKSDLIDRINKRFESTTIIKDGDPSEYMIIKIRQDRVEDIFFESRSEILTVDGIKDYLQEFTDTFDTTYDNVKWDRNVFTNDFCIHIRELNHYIISIRSSYFTPNVDITNRLRKAVSLDPIDTSKYERIKSESIEMVKNITKRISVKYDAKLEYNFDRGLSGQSIKNPTITINPYDKVSENNDESNINNAQSDQEKFDAFKSIFQEYIDSLDHTFDREEYRHSDIKFFVEFDKNTIYYTQRKDKIKHKEFIFRVCSYDDSLLKKVEIDLNKLKNRVGKIMSSLKIIKPYSNVCIYPCRVMVDDESHSGYYNGYKLVVIVESNI